MTEADLSPGTPVRLKAAVEAGVLTYLRPELVWWHRGGVTFHLPWTGDHDAHAAGGTVLVVEGVNYSGSAFLSAPGVRLEALPGWLDPAVPQVLDESCTCPTAALMIAGCRCGSVSPYKPSW